MGNLGLIKENAVQIFNSSEFGEVRTVVKDKEVLFAATDVARALGYSKAADAVTRHCKKEGVLVLETPTENQHGAVVMQEMKFITKGNVIRLVASSKLPTAEKAESWIFDEVIPSVLETGGYIATTPQDTPETIMAKAILYADKKIKEQANAIETLEERTKLQQKELYIAAPKVAYYDAAMESKDTYSTTAIAKDLGMCATKLNTRLNELCIQYQQSGTWYLYAKYQNKGLTRIVPYYFTRSDGSQGNNPRARWTEKGREFILNLRKEGKV